MEKHIKSQTLYSISSLFFFSMCLCLGGIQMVLKNDLSMMIVSCAILGIIGHCLYIYNTKKKMLVLIQTCENIIEEKDEINTLIDGESYISVLSSQLGLLNTRMKGIVQRLHKEQDYLKDYIEDISHQIKTPLTAIMLKQDILLDLSEGKQRDIVEQMIIQTEKIHYCIESLLNLAKVESPSMIYHKEEYSLNEIIDSIHSHLQPLLEKNNVSLKVDSAMINLYCDYQWMSEAIENILKNCIEQKQNSEVDIECSEELQYSKICIHDHGEGFLDEDVHHIFERFYRSQYQTKGKGIGIGLSITKRIIESHHGTIHAYNNHGAVFEIILPKKETKSKYKVT